MLGSDTGIADMTPGERQQLIDRFSRAEELLARIEDAHGSPTEDLTAEEYQSLLALLSGLHEENVKVSGLHEENVMVGLL